MDPRDPIGGGAVDAGQDQGCRHSVIVAIAAHLLPRHSRALSADTPDGQVLLGRVAMRRLLSPHPLPAR